MGLIAKIAAIAKNAAIAKIAGIARIAGIEVQRSPGRACASLLVHLLLALLPISAT
jgi:hypothetical protein